MTTSKLDERYDDLVGIVAAGLLKHWFPNNMPKDLEDSQAWVDIAFSDATAVVEELVDKGIVTTEEQEQSWTTE
jgi:hypothetical protein